MSSGRGQGVQVFSERTTSQGHAESLAQRCDVASFQRRTESPCQAVSERIINIPLRAKVDLHTTKNAWKKQNKNGTHLDSEDAKSEVGPCLGFKPRAGAESRLVF